MKPSGENILAVIMGGGQGQRLYPLTKDRSKPAVPLGGNYRLVDVPISNCINSGLKRIYVLTQFNSVSLHRHIQSTFRFDIFSSGYVDILAAQQTYGGGSWYQGTADAVRQNLGRLLAEGNDYVLILSGDQLYRMDYRPMIQQHIETGADITIANLPVRRASAPSLGIMQLTADRRIVRFVEKPKDPKILDELKIEDPLLSRLKITNGEDHFLASMGIYIFNRQVLAKVLDNDKPDFGKHIIPDAISNRRVFGYVFQGFWEDIGTVRNFFDVHLELARPHPPFDFHEPQAPVFTRPRMLPPSKITNSRINLSLISPGSVITDSEIEEAVIGVRSHIGRHCKLHRVVMMGADFFLTPQQLQEDDSRGMPHMGVGENCTIENTILDKNVRIGDNVKISPQGKPDNVDHPLYCIRDGIVVIPKNSIIPDGTTI